MGGIFQTKEVQEDLQSVETSRQKKTPNGPKYPVPSRSLIMVGLMLTMALAAMDGTIVATAIPTIVRDLGGFSLFPWVFSIYLLVQAVMVPIYGKLADLYGRKPILLFGIIVFLVGSALSGLSQSMIELIVFRGIQGIGAAAIVPMSTTVISDLYTMQERAKMQGYLSSAWGIASMMGPALGGILVQYASWHWIFYINIPIGIGAFWVIGRYLQERVTLQAHSIDIGGAVLLLVGTGALIVGLLEGGVAWSWSAWPSLVIFTLSLSALVMFYVYEARTSEPILPVWVFRRRFIGLANLVSLIVGVISLGLSSYLPTFVQRGLGSTPLVAGFALGAMSVGWPLASALSGKLYLTRGFRTTALIGSGLMISASLVFLALSVHAAPWQAAAASLWMGAGLGLTSTPLLIAVQSSVPWNQRGVVTGSNLFTRTVGSAVGVAVFGTLVNGFLLGWLRHPPRSLSHQWPRHLTASELVSGTRLHSLSNHAAQYVRQGLYLSIHHVFWVLLAVSLFAALVEWALPAMSITSE